MDTRLKLLADTVIRPGGETKKGWYLMNKQETGWAASTEHFAELQTIPKVYRLRLGEFGEDKHGPFIRAIREEDETETGANPFAWPTDAKPGDLPGGGNIYDRKDS